MWGVYEYFKNYGLFHWKIFIENVGKNKK